jgi:glycosyltransferase involved in cell wall biosynthesis
VAQRDALIAAGLEPRRVAAMPEPLEVPEGPAAPRALDGRHGTVVLAVLDWARPAGAELLLDAWCRAFGPDDDVTLLLHATSSDGAEAQIGRRVLEAVRAAGHDPERMPDMVLLEESLPAGAMGSLYSAADVVVAPTVGFGRGRDLLEAMAWGRPVIAPSSALAATIDADAGWQPAVDPRTAAPRPTALVDALRSAHARRGELAGRGARARERVLATNAAGVVARRALARLEEVEPRPRRRSPEGGPVRVALYGAITRAHSLATANRHLAAALVRSGSVDLSVVEVEPADAGADGETVGAEVRRASERLFAEGPEVTIRHGYPPSFARPPAGRLVVALPWEFGAMPRDWRTAINRDVDEVWACSRHLRDGYLASGLDPDLVRVVPHGVDPGRFRPGLEPLPLPGVPGGYRFLFVGGLLWRKGIDLLLDAYRAAFSARDDVTLVIKDFGRGGPYQPQEAEERVRAMAADRSGPRVAFLRDRLTDEEIPRLYASCDCLVHPYRGEGYGLTVAEAMAAGLPVIVPEGGSTADFCDPATALLVPSHPLVLDRTRVGDLDLVGRVSVIEVLALDLAQRMREAYDDREAARASGRRASAHIRADPSWDAAAAIASRRLRELSGRAAPAGVGA